MTVKDLLLKYLDYKCSWRFHLDSKPAKLRLEQIEILLDVFCLSKKHVNPKFNKLEYGSSDGSKWNRKKELKKLSNLQYFENGEFFRDKGYDNYKAFSDKIHKYAEDNSIRYRRHPYDKIVDVNWMFNYLLKFRFKIFEICPPWRGFDEGFEIGLHYAHIQTEELKKIIRENTNGIDEILCFLMDPQKKDISSDDLKTKFNYQDYDFKKVDLNWRMEDY